MAQEQHAILEIWDPAEERQQWGGLVGDVRVPVTAYEVIGANGMAQDDNSVCSGTPLRCCPRRVGVAKHFSHLRCVRVDDCLWDVVLKARMEFAAGVLHRRRHGVERAGSANQEHVVHEGCVELGDNVRCRRLERRASVLKDGLESKAEEERTQGVALLHSALRLQPDVAAVGTDEEDSWLVGIRGCRVPGVEVRQQLREEEGDFGSDDVAGDRVERVAQV